MKTQNLILNKKAYSKNDIKTITKNIDKNIKTYITLKNTIIFQSHKSGSKKFINTLSENELISENDLYTLYKSQKYDSYLYEIKLINEYFLYIVSSHLLKGEQYKFKIIQLTFFNFLYTYIFPIVGTPEHNHLMFINRLDEEIKRGKRYNMIFSVIRVLTRKNSEKTIIEIIKVINDDIRDTDFIGLYNNQPAIILTNTDKDGAIVLVKRIQKLLKLKVKYKLALFPFDGYNLNELLDVI